MDSDHRLRVYLLGSFRLERDGRPIRLPTRKTEALLAYLILQPEPHSREKLAAIFWGESPPHRASGSLRTTVNTLRQRLGNSVVLSDRAAIQLNPSFPRWADMRALEGPESDEGGLADDEWQPGELLAGHYDDWIAPLRAHYGERYQAVLLQRTQTLRAHSDYGRAIALAHRVLALESANERAHQHLMFCHLATGDRDAALAQYERCRLTLLNEFGVEPLPETTALYQWVKQAATPRPSPAALRTNLPIPISSFVGRRRQTAQIKQLLASQAEAEPRPPNRLVTLTGPGGCGKTRLAIQAATEPLTTFSIRAMCPRVARA